MSEERKGYTYQWTQPYNMISFNYTPQQLADGLINKYDFKSIDDVVNWLDSELDKMRVEEELERLEQTDELVSAMTSYPDAERIISKVMGRED